MAMKFVFLQLQSWKFPEYSAVLSDNYIFKISLVMSKNADC